MDSFEDGGWDLLDYCIIEDATSADYFWANQSPSREINALVVDTVSTEKRCKRGREKGERCSRAESKACREKMRREKMNDSDAIHVLNQLRTEARELKGKTQKLREDIRTLKAEKSELREEKLILKADKEKMQQRVKAMNVVPPGYVPAHPLAYQAGANKMVGFPGYGGFQMWQWIPQTVLDTSQDHVLRPPVA
ncbi:transcription factor bHLH104 isoform X2 [Vitis vinifera]|uniref:transcription factor bHLH104 isoform X2 n=1 Tax=Vitis vinifera TaxID=29760 RepID=UPI001FC5AC41|nr:transcription factor bHLH104 isoform X2 [Vitis vinifera]